jgi:ABC transporter with metal-binding/Fe-S-binding domain ATP-binding protein
MLMRIAALCSGGKDSSYALWLAIEQGHEVVHVLAMIPSREDSWMFHTQNIHLIDLFAECVGLPLSKAKTSGEPEQEVKDLKLALARLEVDGVVSGAVASTYQRSRIDRVCRELRLQHIAPLWGREPEQLLREMLKVGMSIILTSASAYGFDESWLGRRIDEGAIEDLLKLNRKYRINMLGEGGEYESLVLDAPFFRKRIEILEAERIWRGDSGYLLVRKAVLKDKSGSNESHG